MGKQEALNQLMGQNAPVATHSLVTGEMTTTADSQAPEALPKPEPRAGLDSDRFAVFAKKEAQLQRERELVKQEREAFQKEKDEVERFKKRNLEFDEMSKKDKVQALKMIGWSDEDIINIMAEQGNKPDASPDDKARLIAQEEAKKVRDELKEELKLEKETQEKSQNDRLIQNLKGDIAETIKSKAETYEFCAFEGEEAETQAYEIIVENLKLGGELLSVDQALDIAEEYYEQREQARLKLKKLAAKEPELPQEEAQKPTPQGNQPNRPRTLTQAMTATTTAMAQKRETREEKRARLENALRMGHL